MSSVSNTSKPLWRWLTANSHANGTPKSANVAATSRGWEMKWPWGNELLAAVKNLTVDLGTAALSALYLLNEETGPLPNLAAQTVEVLVDFNELVAVTGTPTLVAISNTAGVANVTLTYSSTDSDLSLGKLVFKNAASALGGAVGAGAKLTVNSTSTAAGWAGITDSGSNVVANGVTGSFSVDIPVTTALPFQSVNLAGANLANAAGQVLQFTLGFNRPVLVTGTPTISAIGLWSNSVAHANVTVSYVPSLSNENSLVFQSAAQDFSAATINLSFTVNSSSVLTGFAGITDLNGNVAANTISTANTQTVVA